MFGSNVLDVAIGVVFLFLLLSLICSAANELIEMLLKKRAGDLEKGITELLGADATKSFVGKVYDHGLVNSLFRGSYGSAPKGQLPSYIPSRNFALALISIAEDPANKDILPKNVQSAIDAFKKTALDDAEKLQKSVEDWYNSSMDRVSGWYKRRTQIIIFILGAVIAVVVNADCVDYAKKLSKDSSLREGVVALAQSAAKNDPGKAPGNNPDGSAAKPDAATTDENKSAYPACETDVAKDPENKSICTIKSAIASLDGIGLPIGWAKDEKPAFTPKFIGDAIYNHSIGWLLTALAVSLGAPFWFDMLNKLMVVRSTVKPHEKSREEGSKDLSGKASPAKPAETKTS